MMARNRTMRVSGTILIALCIGAIGAFGQNPSPKDGSQREILRREVSLPEFRYTETPTIFQRALFKAQLPGGVVLVSCDDTRRFYALSANKVSLKKLLFNLEQIDPEYTWKFSHGVLNLLPHGRIPELLETPIKKFEVEQATPQEALGLLKEQPEIKNRIVELGLDKAESSISTLQYFDPNEKPDSVARFDLNLEDATFRQILNEIVKARGRMTWVYTEKHCGDETNFSVVLVP